jgi:hydrogenase maturation protease
MECVLIVAYGNRSRCDDGLAWRVADALEVGLPSNEVKILRLHQLAPEVAEAVSHVQAVIFVDAAQDGSPGDVRWSSVGAASADAASKDVRLTHHFSPGTIIALARHLYGATALALSVTLTGVCFDHGETLSAAVADALPALTSQVKHRVRQLLSEMPVPLASRKP